MTTPHNIHRLASGMAALSVCESLLLALSDLKLINAQDAIGVISDAATAHRGAGGTVEDIALHAEVAALLDRIIASGNSVRRP